MRLALLTPLLLVSCATPIPQSITSQAYELCYRHGGLDRVETIAAIGTTSGWGYKARCIDRTVFFFDPRTR